MPRKPLTSTIRYSRIYDEQIRQAILQLREEGHEVAVRVTWDSGDVDHFVREALQLQDGTGYDTLVAGGGDGTLNELVAALLKHDAPCHISVAQLPLGTANDLASAAGISLLQAPLDALRLALDPSTAHPIDVALVNGEVFMNLATAGPVSEVSSKGMSDASKKLLGPAAVAVAGLHQLLFKGLQPVEGVTLTLPNTPDIKHDSYTPDQVSVLSGDLLVLAAGQARQMARLLNVCPDALLDDGLIDFTLLFGSPGKQAAALASEVVASGLSQAQGGVRLLRLPWLIVEAPHGLKCNRDGEPSATSNRLVFEQKRSMKTGSKPRPRLLLDLWAAQQPPGRLSRLLPRLQKAAGRAVAVAGLLAAGFIAGYHW
ncbi:hypothetical protein OEZ86_009738 [Tetradesmus obliquus]|uniref:DAGKc domain-containing protein n=1 Tax=Tetradesmus obliquus TaxID=3088 RepID=A0ABY8UNC4_TETOB|nr:hypothetical protein OEZ85_001181 [Tetradesmus obliquus]WIA43232.1 hypothetical protein OEZ86_009738 [Tetradesmus obliquus]